MANAWLGERLSHLRRITRWGWFVIYELGWLFVFANVDLVIGKYGSEQARTTWDRFTHPHWGWRTLLIGALVIAIVLLTEGSYKSSKERDREFTRERQGLESTHALVIRNMAEKAGQLNKELEDEKAKQKHPRLFLEYSSSVAAKYTLTFSGLFLKNDGGRAFNIEFEPEVRKGLTLDMDKPPGSVEAGTPYPVNFQYCTVNNKNVKNPMGGALSGRIAHLFNDLIHDGEDSFAITIKCQDFEGHKFAFKTILRIDRWTSEITSELV